MQLHMDVIYATCQKGQPTYWPTDKRILDVRLLSHQRLLNIKLLKIECSLILSSDHTTASLCSPQY